MRRLLFLVVGAASIAALAEGEEAELVEQESRNAWHFRIGPVMAPRVRVRVHGPRNLQPMPLTIPGSTSSGTGDKVPASPSAGYADRKYTDGYVKPDEGTDDPDSMISGLTWNWGAKNLGSQYTGGKMEFHTGMSRWSESVSSSSYGSGGSGSDSDRDVLLGFEAMGGWTFFENEMFDAALDAGFRFYGSGDLESESKYGTSVTTTRSRYRYVDSYDASGWTDRPTGSYEGTPGGPGRILGATPTRREELMDSTSTSERRYYSASTKLDYRIWDLRLGPTAGWKALDWLTLRGGVYGLLGLVDARLRTDIDVGSGSYGAKKSTCEGIFGVAAGLSAQVNFTDKFFLMGSAEYDWWSDAVSLRAGGADAQIKLSDFTLSLALGMEF